MSGEIRSLDPIQVTGIFLCDFKNLSAVVFPKIEDDLFVFPKKMLRVSDPRVPLRIGQPGKEDEIKENFNPLKAYGISFIMALIMGYVLAHVLQAWDDAYGITGWAAGMQGAFWSWLRFVITIGYQSMAWEGKKFGLFAMNMAYNLVVLLGMGAILGVWR